MNHYNLNSLKEMASHGDLMFPMKIYNTRLGDNLADLCLHWHDEMEMIYVLEGKGSFQINLESYDVKKGDIIFISPQSIHSASHNNYFPLQYDAIVFHLDMLKSSSLDAVSLDFIMPLLNGEITCPVVLHPNHIYYEVIKNTLVSITTHYKCQNPVYQLEIKSLLFHLFALLYGYNFLHKNTTREKNHSLRIEKVKVVIQYILNHYNEELSVKQLADLLQYSEYHFIHFFKEQTGFTCTQYINRIRLQHACEMLLSTALSVTDIALEVGFQNISYFIRSFKEKYNYTPNAYRKKFSPEKG